MTTTHNGRLTGTEKQIAWATDLRAEAAKNIAVAQKLLADELRADYEELSESAVAELIAAVSTIANAALARTDAEQWIDGRADFAFDQNAKSTLNRAMWKRVGELAPTALTELNAAGNTYWIRFTR
jgi:hypothetical protein